MHTNKHMHTHTRTQTDQCMYMSIHSKSFSLNKRNINSTQYF